ncbi:Fic/DOC family protein [Streptomyces sp. NPDC001812]|uniref:Fic/DOC family protein n=1 Tax=Streptomyces sp. NPDC001812 TaxID=3364611 RepID=UPI0036B63C7E
MNDPYAMPNGVLRNKLGITDPRLLAAAEADITRARLVMLTERPLPGAYDLGHLQAFHATVFGDIYPWAGELRTVNIAKRTPFCPARNLVPYAGEVFGLIRESLSAGGPGSVVVGMRRSEAPPGNRRVN